jgi:TIR domain
MRIFTKSKVGWVTLPESTPAYEIFYDRHTIWPAASLEPLAAVFAAARLSTICPRLSGRGGRGIMVCILGSPRRVFVSYSRSDFYFAEQLAVALRRRGIDVWFDVHELAPGNDWWEAVARPKLGAADRALMAAFACHLPRSSFRVRMVTPRTVWDRVLAAAGRDRRAVTAGQLSARSPGWPGAGGCASATTGTLSGSSPSPCWPATGCATTGCPLRPPPGYHDPGLGSACPPRAQPSVT